MMETGGGTGTDRYREHPAARRRASEAGNSLGNPNYPNVGDTAGRAATIESSARVFREATGRIRRTHGAENAGGREQQHRGRAAGIEAPRRGARKAARGAGGVPGPVDADPSNVAASNDVAISESKIAEMLDAAERQRSWPDTNVRSKSIRPRRGGIPRTIRSSWRWRPTTTGWPRAGEVRRPGPSLATTIARCR